MSFVASNLTCTSTCIRVQIRGLTARSINANANESTCTARKLLATPSRTRGTVFRQDLHGSGANRLDGVRNLILQIQDRVRLPRLFVFIFATGKTKRTPRLAGVSIATLRGNQAPTRNQPKTNNQNIHRLSHSIARMRAQITLTFSMRALRADMSNLSSSLHTPSRCMSTRVLAQMCAVQRHARDRVDATLFRAICSLHALLASNRALKVRATLFLRAEGMRTLGPAEAQPLPACQDQ